LLRQSSTSRKPSYASRKPSYASRKPSYVSRKLTGLVVCVCPVGKKYPQIPNHIVKKLCKKCPHDTSVYIPHELNHRSGNNACAIRTYGNVCFWRWCNRRVGCGRHCQHVSAGAQLYPHAACVRTVFTITMCVCDD
jgi:hypothetical protein